MQVKIMGIDPGLASTGWATLEGDTTTGIIRPAEYGVIQTMKWADKRKTLEIPMRDRIDQICFDVQQIVAEVEPSQLVMEDFVFFRNKGANSSIMPALVEGIRVFCKQLGYSVTIYPNGTWKKALIGLKTANKNQIQHFLHRALELDTTEWDAKDRGGHIRDSMALALTYWRQNYHRRR